MRMRYSRLVIGSVFTLSFLIFYSSCDQVKKQAQHLNLADSSLAHIKSVPHFQGVESSGAPFDSDSLKGSIWIASFMFSSCQGVCPVMNSNLSAYQADLKSKDVKFVSITVDPTTDTPEVLRHYAEQYKAEKGRWYFVRMPKDSVRKLSVKGFLLSDPVEPSDHSPRYALVDWNGDIRGYYDSMDSSKVQQLHVDVEKLLKARGE